MNRSGGGPALWCGAALNSFSRLCTVGLRRRSHFAATHRPPQTTRRDSHTAPPGTRSMRPMKRHSRGFTLIELMVSIFVLGILTALAVPSFVGMMNRNRLASQSNELLAAVQYARIEAIRTNAKVTFCGAATATVSAV